MIALSTDPEQRRELGDFVRSLREKLTPAFVAKATISNRQRIVYWDEGLTGFGLMVTKNGHKSFVVDYRANRRKRRMHLKAGLTLTEARKEAKAILGRVAKGGDPLGKRREAEQAKSNTLKAIVEEYLAREGDRLRTIGESRAVLRRLVFPKLGARQISGEPTEAGTVRARRQLFWQTSTRGRTVYIDGHEWPCYSDSRVLIPAGGFSHLDAPGGPFWDPVADEAFSAALRRDLTPEIPVDLLPLNINDPSFAAAAAEAFLGLLREPAAAPPPG